MDTVLTSNDSKPSDWFDWNGLYINLPLFANGLVVVSSHNSNDGSLPPDGGFSFKKGRFVFSSITTEQKSVQKTVTLANQLLDFAVASGTSIKPLKPNATILFNQNRREEVFLPIVFEPGCKPDRVGVYLYPWATKSIKSLSFSGFTQFVTAGCLFGACMRGYTTEGVEPIKFLDHHLQFQPDQCITSIVYDHEERNPFEMVVMSECKKICLLIDSFVKTGERKKLLYHLPAFDYILFCINLFIQKHMTYSALDDFIKSCLLKQVSYKQQITEICIAHNIDITFHSPFDNIFYDVDLDDPTSSILSKINLNPLDSSYSEASLVAICIEKLKTNSVYSHQRLVWEDFFKVYKDTPPPNLDALFKLANAVIVAMAAYGRHNFETCVLLPLSEKQIQVGYNKYSQCAKDVFKEENSYPNTLNFTVFDPVIAYEGSSDGLLFYFSCKLEILSRMIADKKIVEGATRNFSSPLCDIRSLLATTPTLTAVNSITSLSLFMPQHSGTVSMTQIVDPDSSSREEEHSLGLSIY